MRTILVVDDHIATLQTLCLILKAHKFNVLSASDAREAQNKFTVSEVDMVIVDHGLLGISGADLAEQFKATRDVLIIMLSGNPELLGRPEWVDLLLAKPISVPQLLAEIDGLFSSGGKPNNSRQRAN